jgi:hypothetical protein
MVYERRKVFAPDSWFRRAAESDARIFCESVVVPVHRIRRTESVSVSVQQLVSDDDVSTKAWRQTSLRFAAGKAVTPFESLRHIAQPLGAAVRSRPYFQ